MTLCIDLLIDFVYTYKPKYFQIEKSKYKIFFNKFPINLPFLTQHQQLIIINSRTLLS